MVWSHVSAGCLRKCIKYVVVMLRADYRIDSWVYSGSIMANYVDYRAP